MAAPRFVEIDGKLYAWRDVLAMRQPQLEAFRRPAEQSALFDLIEDHRTQTQRTASNRYSEPSLFNLVNL